MFLLEGLGVRFTLSFSFFFFFYATHPEEYLGDTIGVVVPPTMD